MSLPTFFICGAAKSGTTSLYRYLNQHPSIFLPTRPQNKEPGYFSSLRPLNGLLDSYTKLFSEADNSQIIGEASTAYLTSTDSAKRIYKAVPSAKIIIMLRNPVDRAYSLYKWMAMSGYEYASTFEKARSLEKTERFKNDNFKNNNPEYYYNYLYINSGFYSKQIKRYLRYFPRNQIKFIVFEKIIRDPVSISQDVFEFLGVDSSFEPKISIYNKGKEVYSVKLQYFFRQYLSRIRILNEIGVIEFLMNCNIKNEKKQMNLELRRELLKKYRDDIIKTEELIGNELTKYWLKQ